jgi:hypothetical protein
VRRRAGVRRERGVSARGVTPLRDFPGPSGLTGVSRLKRRA